MEHNSVLQMAPKRQWVEKYDDDIKGCGVTPLCGWRYCPFLSSNRTRDIALVGAGNATIDGQGKDWWPSLTNIVIKGRPMMLQLFKVDNVIIKGIRFRDAPAYFMDIAEGGRNYSISDLTLDAPDWAVAPNTDGIDIAAYDVHVRNVSVRNGDDSLCIKSPAGNVLIEDSTVSQGNGLVVGTDDHVDIQNIVFRNIKALDTTFGCHFKFKYPQVGKVRNVTYENVYVEQRLETTLRRIVHLDHRGYAMGIHMMNQGRRLLDFGAKYSSVAIEDVTYRNISGSVIFAGEFLCGETTSKCRNLKFEHINLKSQFGGCKFENVVGGDSVDVFPESCKPPSQSPLDSMISSSDSESESDPLVYVDEKDVYV
jgi:hypothetical protein